MIDFTVAYDKLAQFDTPDEIVKYLKFEGIKALRANAKFCAVSEYMKNMTGQDIQTVSLRVYNEDENYSKPTTLAMCEFIRRFDHGDYPELVRENDPYTLFLIENDINE